MRWWKNTHCTELSKDDTYKSEWEDWYSGNNVYICNERSKRWNNSEFVSSEHINRKKNNWKIEDEI